MQVADDTPSAATQTKLRELLRALSAGLRRNGGIEAPNMLEFARSVLKSFVGEMSAEYDAQRAEQAAESNERAAGYRPLNCLLFPLAPRRQGVISKTSTMSKIAVFVEFGFQLLGDIVDTKHFALDDADALPLLDPFLALIIDSLRLKYEKAS